MIIYQALTRLFGEGKFSSFDQKTFTYLKGLHISHIWYTGVIRHSLADKSYVKGDWGCPYSIMDYYDVNPYLADSPERRMEEFDNLISRTHDAGFKVIIDFVPNHVSPDYSDSYGGIKTFHRCDYDWTDTDKIDYSDRANWDKLLSIIKFWAGKGVDGFRCDMAELVPVEFWHFLISEAKKAFPSVTFIAEAYSIDNYGLFTNRALFDYLYDKSGLYDTLRAVTCQNGSARGITQNWQRLGELQPRMLNFLENHDEQRLSSAFFAGSPQRGYAALAVSALFYPCPFMLYFGQELGESAAAGDNGRTSIFSHESPIEISPLSASQKEVLKVYKRVLALKESLRDAPNFDLSYCQSGSEGFDVDRHFAFLRKPAGRKEALVACNFSDSPAAFTLRIPPEAGSRFCGTLQVNIPANDFIILRK